MVTYLNVNFVNNQDTMQRKTQQEKNDSKESNVLFVYRIKIAENFCIYANYWQNDMAF